MNINLMSTMLQNVSTNLKFGESRIGQKPKTEFCDRKTERNSSNLTKPRRMGPQMKKMLRATLNFSPSRFFDENVRNQRHKLLDRSPQEQSVQATSVAETIKIISVVIIHNYMTSERTNTGRSISKSRSRMRFPISHEAPEGMNELFKCKQILPTCNN